MPAEDREPPQERPRQISPDHCLIDANQAVRRLTSGSATASSSMSLAPDSLCRGNRPGTGKHRSLLDHDRDRDRRTDPHRAQHSLKAKCRRRFRLATYASESSPRPGRSCRRPVYRSRPASTTALLEVASPVTYLEYERPALEVLLDGKNKPRHFHRSVGRTLRAHSHRNPPGPQHAGQLQRPARLHRPRRRYPLLFRGRCAAELLLFKYCGQPWASRHPPSALLNRDPHNAREGTRTPKDCSTRS